MTGHNEQWQPRFPVGARLAALNGEEWRVIRAVLDLREGETLYLIRRPHLVSPTGKPEHTRELVPLEFTVLEVFLQDMIHSYSTGGEDAGVQSASTGESPAVLPGSPGEDGRRAERGQALDRRGARDRARRFADWRRGRKTARTHLGGRRQRAESAAGIIRKRAQARRTRIAWLARLCGVMLVLLGVAAVYWGVTGLMSSVRVVQVMGGLVAVVVGLCLVTVPTARETKGSRPRQRKKKP